MMPPIKKHKTGSSLQWAAGIRAGYEKGLSTGHADKILAGPYLQFQLGANVSVTFSPAYKFGSASQTSLLSPTSFFQVTNSRVDSLVTHDTTGNAHYYYRYRQNYDSVIVSYQAGKKVWEVELPLAVGIRIAKNLAIYAGPVFSFGNRQTITGTTSTFQKVRQDSIINASVPVQGQFFTNYFAHNGQDSFSTFSPAPYQNATSNPVRLGYVAGLTFMFNRLLIDLSVQQSLSGYGAIPNSSVQQMYKQPYVRIGVGYSIFKSKPRPPAGE